MSRRGYSYWVSDEQLFTFARLPLARRLRWLEEMREITFKLAPPHVRETWQKLRPLTVAKFCRRGDDPRGSGRTRTDTGTR